MFSKGWNIKTNLGILGTLRRAVDLKTPGRITSISEGLDGERRLFAPEIAEGTILKALNGNK
jgi:hypothetical protein